MNISSLQKYLWTAMGMRPTESEFGSMPYYRMADVEDLVRKLEEKVPTGELKTFDLLDDQIGDLTAKLKYVIKEYHSVKPLEEGIFTFPDGDSWDLKDSSKPEAPIHRHQWVVRENEFPEDERCEVCDMLKSDWRK